MAFSQPVCLSLLLLLPYFAWLGRPMGPHARGRAWAALSLRCAMALLIVLSLAGVQSVRGGDELAVVFALDVSDSMPEEEGARALQFVTDAIAALPPGDRAALIVFGDEALVERPMSTGGGLGEVTSIPHTHQTDIAGAIHLALALFPPGAARRIVLLSDGRPTTGDAETAVLLARSHGVRVDVVPLAGTGTAVAEVWLDDLTLPTHLFQREEFSLTTVVGSTVQTEAVLTILCGQRVVGQETVHLGPGTNRFAVPLVSGEPGFVTYRAVVSAGADTYAQNNALSAFTLVEGPPRVLLVAADADEAIHLREALQAAGLEVEETAPGAVPAEPVALARYAAVVLVDTPAQDLAPQAMEALRSFVRDLGGGLVAVGGPSSYGVGGWYDTPLEEVLPVEMTVRDEERFPPMSIVVIIDKSGSMAALEGGVPKIRLAGEAAARVAELITDLDEITVIAFDTQPVDVIGPLPGSQRTEVTDRVIRLQAGGGGIHVRASLLEALDILADSGHPLRHIVLLADGSDAEQQEGVFDLVRSRVADEGITLSTVAIGAGPDLGFLRQIAALGGGRFHFTDRAANLPVIFAQETQLAMRNYLVEESFYPRMVSSSPVLNGIEAVPALMGYVATSPKPAAQVLLQTHLEDPLLAVWQFGLGRAAAWTSDATARWAQQWVDWEDFARFWSQLVRWTIVQRTDAPVEVQVRLEGDSARIGVDAIDAQGAFVNGLDAAASVVGPEGEASVVPLHQVAPGRYEGEFTPQMEGAYLLRLTGSLDGDEAVALTTGWVLGYSPEYAALQPDPAAMLRLAELGGGTLLEEPASAVAHTVRGDGIRRDLWPVLLTLAAVLLPFDVAVRRLVWSRGDAVRAWSWLRERLPQRRAAPAAPPSPLSRLLRAKDRADRPRRAPHETAPLRESPRTAPRREPPPPTEAPSEAESLARRLLEQKRQRAGRDDSGDTE